MSAQEFINNKSFRRWVYRPSEDDNAEWNRWLAEHPDDRASLEQARSFLLQARGHLPYLSDELVRERTERLLTTINEPTQNIGTIRPLVGWRLVGMAASILLVLGGGFWGWQQWQTRQSMQSSVGVYQRASPSVFVLNQLTMARLVQLPDGSLVRLQPGASVCFLKQNMGQQREVSLLGTAFFEVVKNPKKPFFVHANGMTARVLGTSFTVQAPQAGQPTQILVRTGRVAVYPSQQRGKSAVVAPVVLTANQTATYIPTENRIAPAVATSVQKLAMPMPPTAFVFKRTPLPEVFQALERAYAVHIQYDKALLGQRTLTARLDDESLFEKLSIIATSLDISYELTATGAIQISAKPNITN